MSETSLGELLASDPEIQTKKMIKSLYKALARGGVTDTIARLVATDLGWWYHGPPNCQHMMKILTGESRHQDFKFRPRSIKAFNDRVIAEGWEASKSYWVHVWTIEHGTITQLREYFNTWITVVIRDENDKDEIMRMWQSSPQQRLKRSLPDVVLAI